MPNSLFTLNFILISHLLINVGADIDRNRIYLDITKFIDNDKLAGADLSSAMKSLFKHNTLSEKVEPIFIYYEYDFQDEKTSGVRTALNRIKSSGLDIKLLINIKDRVYQSDAEDLKHFVENRYSSLLDLLSYHSSIVNNLSFEIYSIKNTCNFNSNKSQVTQKNGSIIYEVQELLKVKNISKLDIGYVFDYRHLNCEVDINYKKDADYFIVDYNLKRNDKVFVESYATFKENMKKIKLVLTDSVKNFNNTNLTKNIFYKLSLEVNLDVDDAKNKECFGKGILQSYGKDLVDMALIALDDMLMNYTDTYENVLDQFGRQWAIEEDDLYLILKYTSISANVAVLQNIADELVVPELLKFDVEKMPSFGFLLKEIALSGFNTIMLKGGTWQALVRKGIPDTNCINDSCRPQHVLYLNDMHNSFSEYGRNKNGIQNMLKVSGMNLKGLIFSTYYRESEYFSWSDGVARLRLKANFDRENSILIETGCTEWLDIFGSILHNGKYDLICHALTLQRVLGCGSLGHESTIIVWRGVLKIESDDINSYISNILIKLDALTLGRQILRIRHGANKRIFLRLKVTYEGEKSAVVKYPIYCTTRFANIYRLYEILLTWARIHDFPVILQPIGTLAAYDNPISWQQLQTTIPGQIQNLMELFPIFIRRSYNQSRVFGSWTKGMYSCIEKSTDKLDVEVLDLYNVYIGTTISLNIRSDINLLSSRELKTILLFALGKFMAVEIILSSGSELNILYNAVKRDDFKENLKSNNISQRNIYIGMPANLSNEDSGTAISLALDLVDYGIDVKMHYLVNGKFGNEYNVSLSQDKMSVGLTLKNCTNNTMNILTTNVLNYTNISSLNYLICETNVIPAHNNNITMQDTLNAHLYLKKLFQYFFPNLKEIHFRLHPILNGNTTDSQSKNLLLFLADINKFANTHDIHYFLPALSPQTKTNAAGFWKSKNYNNLGDISSFEDIQAKFLNKPSWSPKLVKESLITNVQTSTLTAKAEASSLTSVSHLTEVPTTTVFSSMANFPVTSSFPSSKVDRSTSELPYQQIQNTTKNEAELVKNLWSAYNQYILMGAAALTFLVLLLVTLQIMKNRKYLTTKEVDDFLKGRRETLEEASLKRKRETHHSFNVFDGLVHQKEHEISKNTIKINAKKVFTLHGNFSKVYKYKMPESEEQILVEICNKRIVKTYFIAMLSEVKMLCYLENHFNIVRFIGCYTKEIQKGVLWIATEFCEGGSLQNYISKFKDKISLFDKFKFAKEIASGMDYLSSQDVIHGDLRTKRIYLSLPNKVCKIGKFGLSRKLLRYQDLVKRGKHDLLPWRWMAVESLETLEFSTHSDIWSFGVTIWEIFTLGMTPYEEIVLFKDNGVNTFIDQLKDGKRLMCPSDVTSKIYQLMIQCWTLESQCRPDFSKLAKFFTDQLPNVNMKTTEITH